MYLKLEFGIFNMSTNLPFTSNHISKAYFHFLPFHKNIKSAKFYQLREKYFLFASSEYIIYMKYIYSIIFNARIAGSHI